MALRSCPSSINSRSRRSCALCFVFLPTRPAAPATTLLGSEKGKAFHPFRGGHSLYTGFQSPLCFLYTGFQSPQKAKKKNAGSRERSCHPRSRRERGLFWRLRMEVGVLRTHHRGGVMTPWRPYVLRSTPNTPTRTLRLRRWKPGTTAGAARENKNTNSPEYGEDEGEALSFEVPTVTVRSTSRTSVWRQINDEEEERDVRTGEGDQQARRHGVRRRRRRSGERPRDGSEVEEVEEVESVSRRLPLPLPSRLPSAGRPSRTLRRGRGRHGRPGHEGLQAWGRQVGREWERERPPQHRHGGGRGAAVEWWRCPPNGPGGRA